VLSLHASFSDSQCCTLCARSYPLAFGVSSRRFPAGSWIKSGSPVPPKVSQFCKQHEIMCNPSTLTASTLPPGLVSLYLLACQYTTSPKPTTSMFASSNQSDWPGLPPVGSSGARYGISVLTQFDFGLWDGFCSAAIGSSGTKACLCKPCEVNIHGTSKVADLFSDSSEESVVVINVTPGAGGTAKFRFLTPRIAACKFGSSLAEYLLLT
jgi:hypothetical protein